MSSLTRLTTCISVVYKGTDGATEVSGYHHFSPDGHTVLRVVRHGLLSITESFMLDNRKGGGEHVLLKKLAELGFGYSPK